jgi:hypothetical protein
MIPPEVARREVASEEEPDESSESASGSEWDEDEEEGSEVQDLGSEEGSGEEEGRKKNVEDVFLQCLPPAPKSKALRTKSHEIVDLTDLETADRSHSSSASSRLVMQPTRFVEGLMLPPFPLS